MLASRSGGQWQLPDEILLNVFGNLSLQDVVRASEVCRAWRIAASSNALWERICRRLWRVWENLPDFEGSRVPSQLAAVQWHKFCRWRIESERSAKQLVAGMGWPLKLPGYLRKLVALGNLVVEELERLARRDGDLEEGTRFFAGLAVERINRSNCMKAMEALLATSVAQLEDQLARGALIIAKLRYEDLDIDAIESRIDDVANVLSRRLKQDAEIERQGGIDTPGGALIGLKLLNALLFRQPADPLAPLNYDDADDPECLNLSASRETFYPPERLYINDVLDSRKGVDLSLGIIHSAVGRRCGIPVQVVAIPMLFMTKVGNEGDAEERFVHLFSGGVLQRDECMELILMMGLPFNPSMLAPVPPSSLLVALCDNLITMYRQGSEGSPRQIPKWRKQMILPLLDLVLLISPDDCSHRFSRAKVLLEMTDFEAALEDLQELLQRADGRGGGGDGQEGIPSALLQQFLQRALERRGVHAAWCSRKRAPRPPHVLYRIGSTIRHRRLLYIGVIFGWDTECSADEEWISTMKVDQLQFGRTQPFYRVLPNQRNRSSGSSDDLSPTATYVPQENIIAAPDAGPIVHDELGMHFRGYVNGKYVPSEYLCHIYPDDIVEPEQSNAGCHVLQSSDKGGEKSSSSPEEPHDVTHATTSGSSADPSAAAVNSKTALENRDAIPLKIPEKDAEQDAQPPATAHQESSVKAAEDEDHTGAHPLTGQVQSDSGDTIQTFSDVGEKEKLANDPQPVETIQDKTDAGVTAPKA